MKLRVARAVGLVSVIVLLLIIPGVPGAGAIDGSVRVSSITDDCLLFWDGSAWAWHLNDSYDIQVGYSSSGQYKVGNGMRFVSVDIPAGSTITSAYITFQCLLGRVATTVKARFTGELSGNASTFSTAANFKGRRGTTVGGANNNYITGNQTSWTIGSTVTGSNYNSPSIVAVLQEMVDRVGTLSNIVIFFDDYADESTHSNFRIREFKSYDNSAAYCPLLVFSYTPAGPANVASVDVVVKASLATLDGVTWSTVKSLDRIE
jgi:hypothetical protein